MADWSIILVAAADGELAELPEELQASFLRIADMLVRVGPQRVAMPHVRPLDGKLWEMRLRGENKIARAIYAMAPRRQLVVVRIFTKKAQKTPRREIRLAEQRFQAWQTETR